MSQPTLTDSSDSDRRPLAALWTPRGRGAVATVRLRGDVRQEPAAAIPFRAANGRPLSAQPCGRVVFGKWGDDPAEDVVACVVDEQTVEIHCHGGEAAAARILEDCTQAGCRVTAWPEMVRLVDGPLKSELLQALAQATTLRAAAILLEQSNGLLREAIVSLAREEHRETLAAGIDALLRWADFGMHLARAWKVVLAGRPNVGKSSLVNALLGYSRSIVFDQPGTTRDVVTATTAIDGWPIEFSDTAGLRQSCETLEAAGIERARGALADADLAIVLIDISGPAHADDRRLLAALPPAIVVAHKCDCANWSGPHAWRSEETRNWLRVSSKTGEGVETLVRQISARLVPEVPTPGTPLPITARQAALLHAARQMAQEGELSACWEALGELGEE